MPLQKIELNQSLAWSLGSLALIALMLVFTMPSVLAAALSPKSDELLATMELDDHLEKHRESMDLYRDRFNGRSVFFTPLRTPPKTKPIPVYEEPVKQSTAQPQENRPPPPPTIYTGPSVMAILGDEVWFVNPDRNGSPLRIRVGEEQIGIEILEVTPPWSVKVRYQTVEFDVPLFELKEFLASSTETNVQPPEGMIETTKSELEKKAAGSLEAGSDKNQPGTEQDPDTSPKSDSPDADKSDTTSPTTGNRGSEEQKAPR